MNDNDSTSRGIPLNAFFLLIAASGVILAMISPMLRGFDEMGVGGTELTVATIVGAGGSCALGIVIGLMHYHRIATAVLGSFLGLLIGAAFGLVLFIPADNFPVVMLTAYLGSLLILGLGVAVRWSSEVNRRRGPRRPADRPAQAAPAEAKPKRHALDPDPEDGV